MTSKKAIIISSAVVMGVCIFAYGWLAYNRTAPVNYSIDQEKEMLLPLLVIYYGEQDTPANRDKYRYLTTDEIKNILNTAVADEGGIQN